MKLLVRILIRGYQKFISPPLHFLGGPGAGCRFTPSCSQYFLEAVEIHGFLRGSWLGIKRLGRCHPWGGLGADPVPPKGDTQKTHCTCHSEDSSHKSPPAQQPPHS